MAEHWDFYLFNDQGAVGSNFLNLALAEDAPVDSHGVLGLIEITMLTPRNDGLSSDSEAEALNALEDAVVGALVSSGAINCGRTTGRGVRTLAFYARDAQTFEAEARAATRKFPAYVCEIEARPDPEWEYYFEFLYPSPEEWDRMKNEKVLHLLLKEGDVLDRPREIEHWAYFDDPAAARAFAEAVSAEGFHLRVPVEKGAEDGKYRVQFWRVDLPNLIDAITLPLNERAANLGGEYDGWECPVVR